MNKRILLVDDDIYIRDVYSEVLRDEEYEVSIAEDGDQALEMIKHDDYDLILLDVMLPKTDGISVLKAIKSDPGKKDIPVVMLTNFGQEDLVKQAVNLGSTEYLLKYNITPGEITRKVKQILIHEPVAI